MPNPYTINFSDPGKSTFTINPGEVNEDTSLKLHGQGTLTYGENLNENILHLLENFANDTPPSNPIEGQQWYDSTGVGVYKKFDGSDWKLVVPITSSSSTPSDPDPGDLWYDTNIPLLKVYDSVAVAFIPVTNRYLSRSGVGESNHTNTMSGNLDMNSNKIINLTDPTNPQDAATMAYVDAQVFEASEDAGLKVNKAGDTMTGLLILSGNPAVALGAATKQYVDDTTVSLSGDTMTGLLVLSANPSAALGAATKQYVDTAESNANSYTNTRVGIFNQSSNTLADPNADRILFWDDSAGFVQWLTIGSGLSISGTTISIPQGPGSGLNADLLDGISSASFVQTSRNINTTAPITGGSNLSADRTIGFNLLNLSDMDPAMPQYNDYMIIHDTSAGEQRRMPLERILATKDFNAGIPGYMITSTGFAIQWGGGVTSGNTGGSLNTFFYPVSFDQVLSVAFAGGTGGDGMDDSGLRLEGFGNSSFSVRHYSNTGSYNFRYIVIGYISPAS